MLLETHRDIATLARAMATVTRRHVGVLLLDSRGALVCYMLFPVAPSPQALIAAIHTASIRRMVVCFLRSGECRPLTEESALAKRLRQAARFLQIHLEILVVTPEGYGTVIHADDPPKA